MGHGGGGGGWEWQDHNLQETLEEACWVCRAGTPPCLSPPLPSAPLLEPWPCWWEDTGQPGAGALCGHWVGLSERQHVWSQHS